MGLLATEDLGFGITRIDADYVKPGIASFYLLGAGDEYAVIETGTVHSVTALERLLASQSIASEQIRYVIPTHVHLDHAGGAGLMMQRFPQAQLLVHPRGARHLIDPEKLVSASRQVYGDELFKQLYGEIVSVPAARVREMADGDVVDLNGRQLLFRHTPGHADHHFCIWDELSRGWFSGDVFGISYSWFRTAGGDFCMPATTPSQFRPEQLKASIEILSSKCPERIFLTHYSALPYSDQHRDQLLAQIDRYCDLAQEHSGDPAALETAIVDYSLEQVAALNPGEDMSALGEQFRHDAQLNAQGLSIWWQRQQA